MPPKTDILVTLFGAGGFLGRYVAQSLLKTGVRVRAAERDPRRAWYLKPLGPLGQFQAPPGGFEVSRFQGPPRQFTRQHRQPAGIGHDSHQEQ